MAFTRIGLCTTTTGWYNSTDMKISSATPRNALYVGWCCDYPHQNDTFNISIRYRGIRKGSPASLPDWSSWKTINLKGNLCNEHENTYYGDYWYAVDLAKFGLGNSLTNGSWSMANRNYDYIEIQIGVALTYDSAPEWNNGSNMIPWEYGTAKINYVPDYKVVSIKKASLSKLEFVTNKPEGWRKDDRWCLELIRTRSTINLMGDEPCYGKMDGKASIWVDKGYIKEDLQPNTPYIINIRIVRDWEPIGATIHTIVSTVTYDDSPQTNKPIARVDSATPDKVVFNITDSGDKGHPIEKVQIRLRGAVYSSDVVEGPIGKLEMAAQPFGTNTYEVVAWNDTYGVSETVLVNATVKQDGNRTHIDTPSGKHKVRLEYNPNFNISVEPIVNTVKFAGRKHPTSFNGIGASTKIDLSGTLIYNDGNEWLALANSGELVIIRFPDGKRYQCSIDRFSVGWSERQIKTISFSGTEVS